MLFLSCQMLLRIRHSRRFDTTLFCIQLVNLQMAQLRLRSHPSRNKKKTSFLSISRTFWAAALKPKSNHHPFSCQKVVATKVCQERSEKYLSQHTTTISIIKWCEAHLTQFKNNMNILSEQMSMSWPVTMPMQHVFFQLVPQVFALALANKWKTALSVQRNILADLLDQLRLRSHPSRKKREARLTFRIQAAAFKPQSNRHPWCCQKVVATLVCKRGSKKNWANI